MTRILSVGCGALLAVTAATFPGCFLPGMYCTEVGCSDGVVVTFEPPLEAEGDYEFAFHLPGGEEVITCLTTIPDPDGRILQCADGGHGFGVRLGSFDDREIQGITLERAPRSVDLSIKLNDEEIRRATLKPSYQTNYPNGEECDRDWGGCQLAFETLKL